MSGEIQKVFVIQEASGQLCTEAIKYALQYLSLKPGDKIKLLRVVQPFKTAPTCYHGGCISLGRNKSKLHSSATYRRKQDNMKKEIQEKIKEYSYNEKIAEVRLMAEQKQVEIELAVDGGSLKEVAVDNARNFEATILILDRQLKNDQKYFMDNLSCGILRMKHDSSIKYIREPKANDVRVQITDANQEAYIREQQEEIIRGSFCSLCKNRRPEIGHTREFSYSELQLATSSFCPSNLLAMNGRRITEGQLSDGQKIVVREHTSTAMKEEEFASMVQKLGRVRHENVAILLGACLGRSQRLLVYEYICNGSLNRHLSNKSCELTWERRVKIAFGAAKGLEYLHNQKIYGNMRPNNIRLTHDYHPLLANVGLARNQYEASNQFKKTRVLKTFEYLAPECEGTGIDLSKADVYSFGVVLLELITGRKTIDETNGQCFLRWARPLLRQKSFHELIDPALQDSHDLHQLYWMVHVADKCIGWDPKRRCSIHKVVKALTCITEGSKMEDFSPNESDLME